MGSLPVSIVVPKVINSNWPSSMSRLLLQLFPLFIERHEAGRRERTLGQACN